jgi:hypothetical protein
MNAPGSPPNTFVLRFWLERSLDGARWRGSAEHIPSGARRDFLQLAELLDFLAGFHIHLPGGDCLALRLEHEELKGKEKPA